MARGTSVNFTAAGTNFTYATATPDIFVSTDIQTLAQAVEGHDHTQGKGLGIGRVQTGTVPAAAGAGIPNVRVNGDLWQWWAASAAAIKTGVDTDSAQTLASKTLTSPTINGAALTGTLSGNATLSGQVTFSNVTAPIITALIGPSNTQQHTLPVVASDTVALIAATQTFTNKTISSGTLSGTLAGNVTMSGQVTFSEATAPIISAKIGPVSGQQHTVPAVASDTIALLAAAQTFTNKTLTSPAISSAALSGTHTGNTTLSGQVTFSEATAPIIAAKLGPSNTQQHTLPVVASDTVALIAATQTFTNKTISTATLSGTQTVTGTLTSSGATLSGTWAGSPTFSGTVTSSGTITSSGGTFSGSWAGSPTFTGSVTFSGGQSSASYTGTTFLGAGATLATTGNLRLPTAGTVVARNAANSGNLTILTTDGADGTVVGNTTGQTNVDGSTSVSLQLASGTHYLTFEDYSAVGFYPGADNVFKCGGNANRWTAVYAVNGAIQTSSRDAKENIAALAPADGLDLIRRTDIKTFNYIGQPERQVGFIAEDTDLLLTLDGKSASPQSTASLALAGVKALDAAILDLEGRLRAIEVGGT